MARRRIVFLAVSLTVAAISGGAASVCFAQSSPDSGPCRQITNACQRAGFAQGAAQSGNGLQVDCVASIMQGGAQPARTGKPLPQIDPRIVAACKARNPKFGEAAGQPVQATPPLTLVQAPVAATPELPAGTRRPNIVFVLTDDLAWNLVQYMPHVLAMQKNGVTFANYFVTDSLCCPSRSSIFTGRFPHDTGVFRNTGADGGYLTFVKRGNDQATFATALAAAGYRTAMLGKYLNGYLPPQHPPEPGWTSWDVAGDAYKEFRYRLNQDGKVTNFDNKPVDYLTDVLAGIATNFIGQAPGKPFMIEIATFAPHAPYVPAPRDADVFPGLQAPRTPAFGVAPDANAPKWLASQPALSDADIAGIDRDYRKRAQSVLAVDKMIGEVQDAVVAIGETDNTYFIFSSDNGYHMGEHRLMPGKMTAYDTDIHVPLIVTGPGVPAGRRIDEITENVDLCPTFTGLGYATPLASVDGHSLTPLLHGEKVAEWRSFALVEHHGPLKDPTDPDAPAARSGNPTTYEALRSRSAIHVEYADGEKEYHEIATDPDELRNTYTALPAETKTMLSATLKATKDCHDAQNCWAAQRPGQTEASR